jgi:poly-gamma-glutamate synthesis protein (capsule biosynthesis protein)
LDTIAAMTRIPRPTAVRAALLLLVVGILAVPLGGALGVGPLAGLSGAKGPGGSPLASATAGPPGSGQATSGPSASAPGPTALPPTPSPTPSLTPSPTPRVALVPVTDFRTTATSTDAQEVRSVLAGSSDRYAALELVAADADVILAAAGAARPADAARLLLAPDAPTLRSDLAAHRDRLAIVRVDQVDPSVAALDWGPDALFGVGRVGSLEAWPLVAPLGSTGAVSGATAGYDPGRAWTLVAGGDVLLDRGVALTVKAKGVDFPFNGGSASITSRYCCSSFGWRLPRTQRTGEGGAVRTLVNGADLAIANFENPAPVKFTWHEHGTVFNADPSFIAGVANAGIDWVSLANNHIRDAGATGILQTIAALDRYGIAHGGAGAGYDAAHAPSLLTARGVKVAVLGYDTIAPSYWAKTSTAVGSAQMTEAALAADIAAARAAGAEVVIVFPHWGVEYTTKVSAQQSRLGRAAIDAGADLVIGNHPHWAGAVEIYKGRPIWYALGNFVFDQTWSEPTMEGLTLELTFDGSRLVQAFMRPHIILDKAQPNFMDPAGSGKVVMDQVLNASKGLLPW